MTKVLVVGCGNIGRWHIKGLELAIGKIRVDAVDCSNVSLKKLKKMVFDSDIDSTKLDLKYFSDLSSCFDTPNNFYDLVIVATSASERLLVVKEICVNTNFSFMILEKPLEQSVAAIEELQTLLRTRAVFVNHPRRLMSFHVDLKQRFSGLGPIKCEVGFPSGGICCNGSHFIDLINWWTGETPTGVFTEGLNSNWFPTKRKGFWDVEGEIQINFSEGSRLQLNSGPENVKLLFRVLTGSNDLSIISEDRAQAVICGEQIYGMPMLPQSKLTGLILRKLVERGECDLPTLEISAECTKLFTASMATHWSIFVDQVGYERAPIT